MPKKLVLFVLIILCPIILFIILFGSNFSDLIDSTPSLSKITSYAIPNDILIDSICLSGKYLYVGGFSSDKNAPILKIIDVSNPFLPKEVGSLLFDPSNFSGDLIKDIYVFENYAYIAFDNKGIGIIDISNHSSPFKTGFYHSPQCKVEKIILQENYLYALICSDLKIVDISDSSLPKEIGNYSFEKEITLADMALKNNYAYVAINNEKEESKIEIVDITNPVSPVKISSYDPDENIIYGTINNISVDGQYAYITTYGNNNKNAWLETINISNLSSLKKTGEFKLSRSFNPIQEIKISGKYLYIAHGSTGLRVIDVSNSLSPQEIAQFNNGGGGIYDFAIGEDYIFAAKPNKLEIIDTLILFENK